MGDGVEGRRVGGDHPGAVDEHVEAAEDLRDLGEDLLDTGLLGDVELPELRGPPGRGDRLDDLLAALVEHVGGGDRGALGGEELRGGPAHPGGRAGDDGDLPGKPSPGHAGTEASSLARKLR